MSPAHAMPYQGPLPDIVEIGYCERFLPPLHISIREIVEG